MSTTERMTTELHGAFGDSLATSWLAQLDLDPEYHSVRDTIHNWDLLLANDPMLKSVWLNDETGDVHLEVYPQSHARARSVLGDVLYSRGGRAWPLPRGILQWHLERTYADFRPSTSRLRQMVTTAALERRRKPLSLEDVL